MGIYEIVLLALVVANFIPTYKGLKNENFLLKYSFEIDAVLIRKEYYRFITSAFLHVSWPHFIFNMLSLYCFSFYLMAGCGIATFLIIYFISHLGGDLLTLFIHRHHGDYSSVGASAAISGLIFASIALFPGMEVTIFYATLGIPGWIYGLFYVGISIYGIKSNRGNLAHGAHLGGALTGALGICLFYPRILTENYITLLLITVPALVFIFMLLKNENLLLINKSSGNKILYMDIDDKYNEERANKQKEIDRLLDKISAHGINSLSEKEKQKLKDYSK